jgi:hypothetical protein
MPLLPEPVTSIPSYQEIIRANARFHASQTSYFLNFGDLGKQLWQEQSIAVAACGEFDSAGITLGRVNCEMNLAAYRHCGRALMM